MDPEPLSNDAASHYARIEPPRRWVALGLVELWAYRELLAFMAWRDVKVRYKQTVLGIAWAVIQPAFTMIVFSIFLGKLARVPSDGIPYPLFSYCALLPWQLFSTSLVQSSQSIVAQQAVVRKVYFPRLVIPLSSVVSSTIDFAVAFTLLIGLMLWYGVQPGWAAAVLPLLILLAVLAALGSGLWLCALNVRYRDFRHAVPFMVQTWLFVTPVLYPSSLVPEGWRTLYGVNPMVAVVEGFRWALLGGVRPDGGMVACSLSTTGIVLVSGLYFFRRMEQTFSDVV